MRKVVGMVVFGLGGLAAAIGLTVGALALAGDEVGTVVQPNLAPSRSEQRAASPSPSRGAGDDPTGSPTPEAGSPSPSAVDHGADPDNSGPGSDGSGSDNSGPGSGSSGSSGSGSGSSGSGSGDD